MKYSIGPFAIFTQYPAFWLRTLPWIALAFVIGHITGPQTVTLEGGKHGTNRALTCGPLSIVFAVLVVVSLVGLLVVRGLLDKGKIEKKRHIVSSGFSGGHRSPSAQGFEGMRISAVSSRSLVLSRLLKKSLP